MSKCNTIIPIIVMILVLFSFSAYAGVEYKKTGFNDYASFSVGQSNFNADVTPVSYSKVLSGSVGLPKSSDLDNDGNVELVVMDSTTIQIYGLPLLTNEDYYTEQYGFIGDFTIHDIDGDATDEIIVTDGYNVSIIGYNGTDYVLEKKLSSFNVTAGYWNVGFDNAIISCYGTQCGIARTVLGQDGEAVQHGNHRNADFYVFNSTHMSTQYPIQIQYYTSAYSCYMFGNTPYMIANDYNLDGDNDYFFVMNELEYKSGTGTNQGHLFSFDASPTLTITKNDEETLSLDTNYQAINCGNHGTTPIQAYLTLMSSPVMYDYDEDGTYDYVAVNVNTDIGTSSPYLSKFKTYVYSVSLISGALGVDSIYPSSAITGQYVSNPIIADCFQKDTSGTFSDKAGIMSMVWDLQDGTGYNELGICVNKYDSLGILGFNSETYNIDDTEWLLNISGAYETFIHAIESDGETGSEIVTTHGVYSLNDVHCSSTFAVCNSATGLELLWHNSLSNNTIVPFEITNNGFSDMAVLRPNNVHYLDDAFVNSNAQIDGFCINPCAGLSTVKQNETISVTITPKDADSDTVRAGYTLYNNDVNSQDSNWSSYYASGTTITLTNTIANKTGSYTLRLYTQDDEHSTNTSQDITFYVGVNGVQAGDCSYCMNDLVSGTTTNATTGYTNETNLADNSITNTVNIFGDYTGLGGDLLWLLIMVIVAIGIWVYTAHQMPGSSAMAFGVIMVVEILMLIIGVKLGFLGYGIIITIVLLGTLGCAGYIIKLMSHGNSPGG